MRTSVLFGLCFVFLAFSSVPVSSDDHFVAGGWEGAASRDKAGRFSGCNMVSTYRSGITLGFSITREYEWGLVLTKPDWEFRPGDRLDISLAIDRMRPIRSIAVVAERDMLVIPLDTSSTVVNAMRKGRLLSVVTRRGRAHFFLDGTSIGIQRLAACVNQQLMAEQSLAGDGVFAELQSRSAASDKFRLFEPTEAVVFAANLLTDAGISGYKFVNPSEVSLNDYDVVWVYPNGSLGALAAFKNAAQIDLDVVAAAILTDDASDCKGDTASGKKAEVSQRDLTIRRLFFACRDGTNSYEANYALVKTANGNIIKFGFINLGEASGSPGDVNDDKPLLESAVLSDLD